MFFAMLFCGEKAWYTESDNSKFDKERKEKCVKNVTLMKIE